LDEDLALQFYWCWLGLQTIVGRNKNIVQTIVGRNKKIATSKTPGNQG
jgi:hypothetical protein